jgi:cytochrome c oxidase assembly protein subunit 15
LSVPERAVFAPWRHRFAAFTVLSTLFLIVAGGLVTSTGSGLAVPDWPLSYGMLMPPMVGGIFYEHGHRMVATFVGFLTTVLAVWTARTEARPAVRRLAWVALGLVIAQGLLGGLTVRFLLPAPISIAHACLAQTFFCVTIALACVTSREWISAPAPVEDEAGLRAGASVAVAAVFLQLLLGAVMRHVGAGLVVPDFPTTFGRWVPPAEALTVPVAVHLAHRAGALVVLAAVATLWRRARRSGIRSFAGLASAALALVGAQILLGGLAVVTGLSVVPTTAHVALGATILGLCFFVALRSRRLLRPRAAAPSAMPYGEIARA